LGGCFKKSDWVNNKEVELIKKMKYMMRNLSVKGSGAYYKC